MSKTVVKKYHPAPEWLTDEYVQDKLRIYYKDEKLELVDLQKIPASAIGENFVSILTRIKVIFIDSKKEKRGTTFLVKTTISETDSASEFFTNFGVYTREMDMYDFVLPKITELVREIGVEEKFFPETIYVDREHSSIIFEDLCLENYVTVDRLERLNYEHAKMTTRKLAMIHAAAAVLNERSPGIFSKNFDRGFFNRQVDSYRIIMESILESFARYLATDPELKAKYYDKIVVLRDNVMEYGCRVTDANDKHFMTLNHGDFWTANIMFRYDENKKPINIIPIDFQFCAWSSPAVDLHFFFNCAMQEDLRQNNQPELQQYYYYIFRDTLKALKFRGRIPSFFNFNMEVQSRRFYAVFSAFMFQPIQSYNGTEEATYENLILQTEKAIRFRDSMFESKIIQKYIGELLPVFDREGLLDVLDDN